MKLSLKEFVEAITEIDKNIGFSKFVKYIFIFCLVLAIFNYKTIIKDTIEIYSEISDKIHSEKMELRDQLLAELKPLLTEFRSNSRADRILYFEYHNSKENLVKLSAREHFICHLLLTKMLEGDSKYKMIYAVWYLIGKHSKLNNLKVNARVYESLKRKFSECNSEYLKLRHQKNPENIPTRQKVSCCSCHKVFNVVSFGRHFPTCGITQKEIIAKERLAKGLKPKQWMNPSPKRGIPMSEANKQKMRHPKTTTENMKKPKSDKAKQIYKNVWSDPIKKQARLEKRKATLLANPKTEEEKLATSQALKAAWIKRKLAKQSSMS
jgi:hypothetical protein